LNCGFAEPVGADSLFELDIKYLQKGSCQDSYPFSVSFDNSQLNTRRKVIFDALLSPPAVVRGNFSLSHEEAFDVCQTPVSRPLVGKAARATLQVSLAFDAAVSLGSELVIRLDGVSFSNVSLSSVSSDWQMQVTVAEAAVYLTIVDVPRADGAARSLSFVLDVEVLQHTGRFAGLSRSMGMEVHYDQFCPSRLSDFAVSSVDNFVPVDLHASLQPAPPGALLTMEADVQTSDASAGDARTVQVHVRLHRQHPFPVALLVKFPLEAQLDISKIAVNRSGELVSPGLVTEVDSVVTFHNLSLLQSWESLTGCEVCPITKRCKDIIDTFDLFVVFEDTKLPPVSGLYHLDLFFYTSTELSDLVVSSSLGHSMSVARHLLSDSFFSFSSLRAGDVCQVALNLTLFNPIPCNGSIDIVFPPHLDLSDVGLASAQLPAFSLLPASQNSLRLVPTDPQALKPGTSFSVHLLHIKLSPFSETISLHLCTSLHAGSTSRAVDCFSQTFDILPNFLSNVDAALTPNVAGAISSLHLKFDLFNSLPAGGSLSLEMPEGVGVIPQLQRSDVCVNTSGLNIFFQRLQVSSSTARPVLSVLDLNRPGGVAAGSRLNVLVPGIVLPPRAGPLLALTVRTWTSSQEEIDSVEVSNFTWVSPGSVKDAEMEVMVAESGFRSAGSIRFQLSNEVPQNGWIKVRFPADIQLYRPTCSGNTRGMSAELVVDDFFPQDESGVCSGDCSLVLLVYGDKIGRDLPVSFMVTNLKKEPFKGEEDAAFEVTTYSPDRSVIDTVQTSRVTLREEHLTYAKLTPESAVEVNEPVFFRALFRARNLSSCNLSVALPPSFLAPADCCSSFGFGEASGHGSILTLLPPPHAVSSGDVVNVSILLLPTRAGTSQGIEVRALDGRGTLRLHTSVPGIDVAPGQAALLAAQLLPSHAGATSELVLRCSFASKIPAEGGGFELHLPPTFAMLEHVHVTVLSGMDGDVEWEQNSPVRLRRVRSVFDVPPQQEVSFKLSGLVNPVFAGTFQLKLSSIMIGQGSVFVVDSVDFAVSVIPSSLLGLVVTPSDLVNGYHGPLKLSFRNLNSIPAEGSFRIVLPPFVQVGKVVSSSVRVGTVANSNVVYEAGGSCSVPEENVLHVVRKKVRAIAAMTKIEVEVQDIEVVGFLANSSNVTISTIIPQGAIDQASSLLSISKPDSLGQFLFGLSSDRAGDVLAVNVSFFTGRLDVPRDFLVLKSLTPESNFVESANCSSDSISLTMSLSLPSVLVLRLLQPLGARQLVALTCRGLMGRNSSGTSQFLVEVSSGSPWAVVEAARFDQTFLARELRNVSVVPLDDRIGVRTTYNISFLVDHQLNCSCSLVLRLPLCFRATEPVAAVFCQASTCSNRSVAVKTTREDLLLITELDSQSDGQVSLQLLGVVNCHLQGSSPVLLQIKDGSKVQANLSALSEDVAAAGATSLVIMPFQECLAAVAPARVIAGEWRDMSFSFSSDILQLNISSVRIHFPPGFDISRSSCARQDCKVVVSQQVLQIDEPHVSSPSSPLRFTTRVLNVRMPEFEVSNQTAVGGPPAGFLLELVGEEMGRSQVFLSSSCPSIQVVPAALVYERLQVSRVLNVQEGPGLVFGSPLDMFAGAIENLTMKFYTSNEIRQGGGIDVNFPVNFNVSTMDCLLVLPAHSATSSLRGSRVDVVAAIPPDSLVQVDCRNFRTQQFIDASVTVTLTSFTPAGARADVGQLFLRVLSNQFRRVALALSSLFAGDETSLLVNLTITNSIPPEGTIEIFIPEGFRVLDSSPMSTVVSVYDSHQSLSASYSLRRLCNLSSSSLSSCQKIVLTSFQTSIPDFSLIGFEIPGLRVQVESGRTGQFLFNSKLSDDGELMEGCDPLSSFSAHACALQSDQSFLIAPSHFRDLQLSLERLTAGSVGRGLLTLTTTTILQNTSYFVLDIPAGFEINKFAPLSGLNFGIDGVLLPSFRNGALVIRREGGSDIPANTQLGIGLAGLKNKPISDCSPGESFWIPSSSSLRVFSDGNVLQVTSPLSVPCIHPGVIEEFEVRPLDPSAGVRADTIVSFRTANPLPGSARIRLEFPADEELSPPFLAHGVENLDGDLLVYWSNKSARVLEIVRVDGSPVSAGDVIRFNLSGVRNQRFSGPNSPHRLVTSAGEQLIDIAEADSRVLVGPADLHNCYVRTSSRRAWTTGDVTVQFMAVNPIPVNGSIEVNVPEGFGVDPASFSLLVNGVAKSPLLVNNSVILQLDEALRPCNASTPEIEVTRESITPLCSLPLLQEPSACKTTLSLLGLRMPVVRAESYTFSVRTRLPDATVVDFALRNLSDFAPSRLTSAIIDPVGRSAGDKTQTFVSFIPPHSLSSDTVFNLVFPQGFDVSQAFVDVSPMSSNVADGLLGLALTPPAINDFTFESSSDSQSALVAGDKLEFRVKFSTNFEMEKGTEVLISSLNISKTPSTANFSLSSEQMQWSSSSWSRDEGRLSLVLKDLVPAGQPVTLSFHLLVASQLSTVSCEPQLQVTLPLCLDGSCLQISKRAGLDLSVSRSPGFYENTVLYRTLQPAELFEVKAWIKVNFVITSAHEMVVSGLNVRDAANLSDFTSTAGLLQVKEVDSEASSLVFKILSDVVNPATLLSFSFVLSADFPFVSSLVNVSIRAAAASDSLISLSQTSLTCVNQTCQSESFRFTSMTISQNCDVPNVFNVLTVTLRSTFALRPGTLIHISNLTSSQTPDGDILLEQPSNLFESAASWNRSMGLLTVRLSPGVSQLALHDVDLVFSFILRNPPGLSSGVRPRVVAEAPGFDSWRDMDGLVLRVSEEARLSLPSITFSSLMALDNNSVSINFTVNVNLLEGSKIRLYQLPADFSAPSTCNGSTLSATPCAFPFVFRGRNYSSCVTEADMATDYPFLPGRPWCATSGSFSDQLGLVAAGDQAVWLRQAQGSQWDYCACEGQVKVLSGPSSAVLGDATWDPNLNLMTISVAPGKRISANVPVKFDYPLRNADKYVRVNLSDYEYDVLMHRPYNPRLVLCGNSTCDGNPWANSYEGPFLVLEEQHGWASFPPAPLQGPSYHVVRKCSRVVQDILIDRRVEVNPDVSSWQVKELDTQVFPSWKSFTVTLLPFIDIDSPVALELVVGNSTNSTSGVRRVRLYNKDAEIFGLEAEYDEESGKVTLGLLAGRKIPCDSLTVVSFDLQDLSPLQATTLLLRSPYVFSCENLAVTQSQTGSEVSAWSVKSLSYSSDAFGSLNLISVTLQPKEDQLAPNVSICDIEFAQSPSHAFSPDLPFPYQLWSSAQVVSAEWAREEATGLGCLNISFADSLTSANRTVVSFLLRNPSHASQCSRRASIRLNSQQQELLDGSCVLRAARVPGLTTFSASSSSQVLGSLSLIRIQMVPNFVLENFTSITLSGIFNDFASNNNSLELIDHSGNLLVDFQEAYGRLVLTCADVIMAGAQLGVSFKMRNKWQVDALGSRLHVLIDRLPIQTQQDLQVSTSGQTVHVRSASSGLPLDLYAAESPVNFYLSNVRLPQHDGLTGEFVITATRDNLTVSESLAIAGAVILPSYLNASVALRPLIVGSRGEVTVEMVTSNPIPPGGFVFLAFPDGFRLDTEMLDESRRSSAYVKSGLQVTSQQAQLQLQLSSKSTDMFPDAKLAISLKNVGEALPALSLLSFTVQGVQLPFETFVPSVKCGNVFRLRTSDADVNLIDVNDHVTLPPVKLTSGRLMDSSVILSSPKAGDVADFDVVFSNFNPLPAHFALDLALPDGFSYSDRLPSSFSNAPKCLVVDTLLAGSCSVSMRGARRVLIEVSVTSSPVLDSRTQVRLRIPAWRESVFSYYGVKNPPISGATGTFQLRTILSDEIVFEEDLGVPPVLLQPGDILFPYLHLDDSQAGSPSRLLVQFAISNPLPPDGRVVVALPAGDFQWREEGTANASSSKLFDPPALQLSPLHLAVDVAARTLTVSGFTDTVYSPCENVEVDKLHEVTVGDVAVRAEVAATLPDYFCLASCWPVVQQNITRDLGTKSLVCGYGMDTLPSSFSSCASSPSTLKFELSGSLDGVDFVPLHQEDVAYNQSFLRPLPRCLELRYLRLTIAHSSDCATAAFCQLAGELRLFSFSAEQRVSRRAALSCSVSIAVDGLLVNRATAGRTGNVQIRTLDASNRIIDANDAVAGPSLTTGSLSDARAEHSSSFVGDDSSVTFFFTTSNALWNSPSFVIAFPPSMDVRRLVLAGVLVDGRQASEFEVAGVEGSELTVSAKSLNVTSGAQVALTVAHVRNPLVGGPGGVYQLTTRSGGDDVDANASVPALDFLPSCLADSRVTLEQTVAGGLTNILVDFTPSFPLPAGSSLRLRLPDDYMPVTEELTARWRGGSRDLVAVTQDEQFIYFNPLLSPAADFPQFYQGQLSIQLEGFRLPARSGPSGSFELCSLVGDAIMECFPSSSQCPSRSSHLLPSSLTPDRLLLAAVRPREPRAGSDGLTVEMQISNELEDGSWAQVALPLPFLLSDPFLRAMEVREVNTSACLLNSSCPARECQQICRTCGCTMNFTSSLRVVSVSNPDAHLLRVRLPALRRQTLLLLSFDNVRVPRLTGPSGSFTVASLNPHLVVVDEAAVSGFDILPNRFLRSTMSLSSDIAGENSTLRLLFGVDNIIPAGGRLRLIMPTSFAVELEGYELMQLVFSHSLQFCESLNLSSPDVSVQTRELASNLSALANVIDVILTDNVVGCFSLSLSSVRNQMFSGPSDFFQLQTLNQDRVLLDENRQLARAQLRPATIVARAAMSETTAGASSQLKISFTPANLLPPGSSIAIVLPSGFEVLQNSSVIEFLGVFAPTVVHPHVLGEGLAVHVLKKNVLTVTILNHLYSLLPHRPFSMIVDRVKSQPYAGTSGTFQVRTLTADNVAIDQDLSIPGVQVEHGSMAGSCPPFCVRPTISLSSYGAGEVVEATLTFILSNSLEADGRIYLALYRDFSLSPSSQIYPVSLLGSDLAAHAAPGILDGNFSTYMRANVLRVQRQGNGRDVPAGSILQFNISNVVVQLYEGGTGSAMVTTLTNANQEVDQSLVPELLIHAANFVLIRMIRSKLLSGALANMTVVFSVSGPVHTGAVLTINITEERLEFADYRPPSSATAGWEVLYEAGLLMVKYLGQQAIPENTINTVELLDVRNPAGAFRVNYVVSLNTTVTAKSSHRSNYVIEYEPNVLQTVEARLDNYVVASQPLLSLAVQIHNPLPRDAELVINLPSTFSIVPSLFAVANVSDSSCSLAVTQVIGLEVRLRRVASSVSNCSALMAQSWVNMSFRGVGSQLFSGQVPAVHVTTLTPDGFEIDHGDSNYLYMLATTIENAQYKLASLRCGSESDVTLSFTTRSFLPQDAWIVVRLPPGFEAPDLPRYAELDGYPVEISSSPSQLGACDPQRLAEGYLAPFNCVFLPDPPSSSPERPSPTLMLQRYGGRVYSKGETIEMIIPRVRSRRVSGFSGTFQLLTLVSSFEMIERNLHVNGLHLAPGDMANVLVSLPSFISPTPSSMLVNFSTSNPLLPESEIHIEFYSTSANVEQAQIGFFDGPFDKLVIIGTAISVGGNKIVKMKPQGVRSLAQAFAAAVRLDGLTFLQSSPTLPEFLVRTISSQDGLLIDQSNLTSADVQSHQFGIALVDDSLFAFDASNPDKAVRVANVSKQQVAGGISAVDRASSTLWFIDAQSLVSLDLHTHEIATVLLKNGAFLVNELISLQWDSNQERLMGIAILEDGSYFVAIDRFSGNVTRLSVVPSCGSIECALLQGLSTFNPVLGLYHSASFFALLTLNSTTGEILSHASWQVDVPSFDGFVALHFAANSSLKASGDDGLLGVSTLGATEIAVFSVNSYSGRATKMLRVLEAELEADLTIGPSSLSNNELYLILYPSRLVLVDLLSGAVSFLAPLDLPGLGVARAEPTWLFLQLAPFRPSARIDMFDDVQVSVWDDNVTVLGLQESLPLTPGSYPRSVYFSITLLGSGVHVNDSVQITRAGDCRAPLLGGGPFLVLTPELHTQDFALDFTDEQEAQICLLSGNQLDRTFRVIPWAPDRTILPLSQAVVVLPVVPLQLGIPVLVTMTGLLSSGDQLMMAVDDGTAQPVDRCRFAQLVPGTEVLEIQTGGFSLTQPYSHGSSSLSTFPILLTHNSTSSVTFCYRRRGLASFLPVPFRQAEEQPSPVLKFSVPVDSAGLQLCGSSNCQV